MNLFSNLIILFIQKFMKKKQKLYAHTKKIIGYSIKRESRYSFSEQKRAETHEK